MTQSTHRRGFSLVEMTVVIGIVVLLAGIVVVVGQGVVNQSRVQETRRSLQLLDMAVQEWQLTSDRTLSWWDQHDVTDPGLFDLHSDTPEVLIITEMLEVIRTPDGVQRILAQFDPDVIHTYRAGTYPSWLVSAAERDAIDGRFDGGLTILDAWGTPIYATHPGRKRFHTDVFQQDEDGTIRTYNELKYGVARNQQICFVSAGPDGQFGWLNVPPSTPFFQMSQDNVYSYEPDAP